MKPRRSLARATTAALACGSAAALCWSLCRDLAAEGVGGALRFLVAALLALVLLPVLTARGARARGKGTPLFLVGVALTAIWLVLALAMLTRGAPGQPAPALLGAVYVLIVAGLLALERAVLGPRAPGLLALALGAILLLSPFCLDAWVERSRGGAERAALAFALRTSPFALAAHGPFELDLLKLEGVYGRFRVGEQLYGRVDARASWPALGAAGAGIFLVGLFAFAWRSRRENAGRESEPLP